MSWESYNAKCSLESQAVCRPWMWPGNPRSSWIEDVCAITLPCSGPPAHAYVRRWVLAKRQSGFQHEEYRSIEVQERLAIIISHGPSFLPSSFSLLPRDFLTSPWNNPSRMAIWNDLAYTLNLLHLSAFPTLSFLGGLNLFFLYPSFFSTCPCLLTSCLPPPPCPQTGLLSWSFQLWTCLLCLLAFRS